MTDWTNAACRPIVAAGYDPWWDYDANRTAKDRMIRDAKEVCAGCPLLAECRERARETDRDGTYGIWAGMTPAQRTQAGVKQRQQHAAQCGTVAAYRAHRAKGEYPCGWCCEAKSAYNARQQAKRKRAAA